MPLIATTIMPMLAETVVLGGGLLTILLIIFLCWLIFGRR